MATGPLAVDDSAVASANTTVTISVLKNDELGGATDPNSLRATVSPAHGSVTKVGSNLKYSPDTDFVGVDSFTYEICSHGGVCDTAIVRVLVEP